MKNIILLLAFAAAMSAQGQVIDKNGTKGSLWIDGSSPFLDRTARKVGDLITIVISEQSAATFTANTTLSKSDSNKISTSFFNNFLDRIFRPWATSSSSSNSGSGTTLQNGKVSARMTGIVKEVLPNGSLVIEGARLVTVNREDQTFKLSGIVRRDDVRPDNTVLSESLADANIKLEGKGAIYDRNRRGLLTRILDWLF